jgi:hypothetical protein
VVSFPPWKFCAFSLFFAEKLLEKNLENYMFINQYKMFFFPAKNCHFCEIKNLKISNRKNQPISFCQRVDDCWSLIGCQWHFWFHFMVLKLWCLVSIVGMGDQFALVSLWVFCWTMHFATNGSTTPRWVGFVQSSYVKCSSFVWVLRWVMVRCLWVVTELIFHLLLWPFICLCGPVSTEDDMQLRMLLHASDFLRIWRCCLGD